MIWPLEVYCARHLRGRPGIPCHFGENGLHDDHFFILNCLFVQQFQPKTAAQVVQVVHFFDLGVSFQLEVVVEPLAAAGYHKMCNCTIGGRVPLQCTAVHWSQTRPLEPLMHCSALAPLFTGAARLCWSGVTIGSTGAFPGSTGVSPGSRAAVKALVSHKLWLITMHQMLFFCTGITYISVHVCTLWHFCCKL